MARTVSQRSDAVFMPQLSGRGVRRVGDLRRDAEGPAGVDVDRVTQADLLSAISQSKMLGYELFSVKQRERYVKRNWHAK